MPKEVNPPHVSPEVWRFPDYQGNTVTITAFYNNNSRGLSSIEVVRDTDCVYKTLLWGLGDDGIPDNTTKKFPIPVGSFTISKGMLNAVGLSTFEDLMAVQFTVGF